MNNDPKIWWIRGNFWIHQQCLVPIEADSEQEALSIFKEGTKEAKDVIIEGVSQDPEELMGPHFGDVVEDNSETKRVLN